MFHFFVTGTSTVCIQWCSFPWDRLGRHLQPAKQWKSQGSNEGRQIWPWIQVCLSPHRYSVCFCILIQWRQEFFVHSFSLFVHAKSLYIHLIKEINLSRMWALVTFNFVSHQRMEVYISKLHKLSHTYMIRFYDHILRRQSNMCIGKWI